MSLKEKYRDLAWYKFICCDKVDNGGIQIARKINQDTCATMNNELYSIDIKLTSQKCKVHYKSILKKEEEEKELTMDSIENSSNLPKTPLCRLQPSLNKILWPHPLLQWH